MPRQYRNAPLREAICDFRFEPGEPWDGSQPGRLYERLRDQFPVRQPVLALEQSITAQPGEISHRVVPVESLRLLSESGTSLIQVGIHHLSVHHLPIYPGWPHFRPMIDDALEQYREVANPNGLQRVGLRYINQVRIPEVKLGLNDYFDFYPYVGKLLPQDYGAFDVTVYFGFDDHRDGMRLQLSAIDSDQPGVSVFALDLDYFLNQPEAIGFDAITQWLEVAHTRIEETFEGCITQTLREMFGEVGK